jgi:hypothetical protein
MKPHILHSTLRLAAIAASLSLLISARQAHAQYSFFPLSPCRVVDTRNPVAVNGGPVLSTTRRDFAIKGNCGVPASAKAISMNVTVANPTTTSFLAIWPSGQAQPVVSTINFTPSDSSLANGAIVGLSANAQDLSVRNSDGQVHVILDITGYFQ